MITLFRGRGEAVHTGLCHHANRDGMVHWRWAEDGAAFWWEDGHPVRRDKDGNVVVKVMWLRACKQCRPDLAQPVVASKEQRP